MRLYGREKVFAFVAASLERAGNPRTPAATLIVGQCGAGKTVLLEQIEERHRNSAPTARLDLAGDQDATPLTVMLTISKALSRRVARVGVIPFPLLRLGICALSLDPHGAVAPADQLDRRLGGHDQPGQELLGAAARAAELLPPGKKAVVTEAAALAGWVCSGISGRRLGKHLSWYSAALPGQDDGTPLGPLVGMHKKWQLARGAGGGQGPAGVARREVWEVLCSALLADLRADFNEFRWRHGRRTTNCLLLLDNADTDAGQIFLEALAKARMPRPGQTDPEADPLMLAAAQRSMPGPGLQVGEFCLDSDDALQHGGWTEARQQRGQPPGWCPVMLTDLSASLVQGMVRSTVLGQSWRDADFLQDITGGHPAVTRLFAERLSAAPPGCDAPRALGIPAAPDAAGAADASLAAGACLAADDDLIGLTTPDWVTGTDLDKMAVCAATPGVPGTACTSVFGYLGWAAGDVPRARDMMLSLMWADQDAGGGQVIQPLPRLLLTRRIARDEARWQDVHYGYQSHYDGIGDWAAGHYHRLARATPAKPGDLQAVAGYLDGYLDGQRAPSEWNDTLAKITAAPNRLATADVYGAVNELGGIRKPGDRCRTVARLIAARWLYRDRLLDPAHSLAQLIADEYRELAALTKGNTEAFFQVADQFRRIARIWGE